MEREETEQTSIVRPTRAARPACYCENRFICSTGRCLHLPSAIAWMCIPCDLRVQKSYYLDLFSILEVSGVLLGNVPCRIGFVADIPVRSPDLMEWDMADRGR